MGVAVSAVVSCPSPFQHGTGPRTAAVVFHDADGGPGTIGNLPGWTSSDPSVLAVIGAGFGMSVQVRGVAAGTATLTATADDGSGNGISGTLDVVVT